jgi:hypothetical protein
MVRGAAVGKVLHATPDSLQFHRGQARDPQPGGAFKYCVVRYLSPNALFGPFYYFCFFRVPVNDRIQEIRRSRGADTSGLDPGS